MRTKRPNDRLPESRVELDEAKVLAENARRAPRPERRRRARRGAALSAPARRASRTAPV